MLPSVRAIFFSEINYTANGPYRLRIVWAADLSFGVVITGDAALPPLSRTHWARGEIIISGSTDASTIGAQCPFPHPVITVW